jgi:hypothetical protein
LISGALTVLLVWVAYQHVPEVRNVIQRLPEIWEHIRQAFAQNRQ